MEISLHAGSQKTVSIHSGLSLPSFPGDLMRWVREGSDKNFILTDTNTRALCLPVLLNRIPELGSAEILEIDPGENSKSLDTAGMIWSSLLQKGASRNSLLINLGGGVVSDLGGFVASVYKRGIRFLQIPTTLTGMADASIGGKTGINLRNSKNQLGTFSNPEAILISTGFLRTLERDQLLDGVAEILKSALIADEMLWEKLSSCTLPGILDRDRSDPFWLDLVDASVRIKCRIVEQDFQDQGIRSLLNFGHTLGHALESLFLTGGRKPLSHGHAVALGMICESFLSSLKNGLRDVERQRITRLIRSGFDYYPLEENDLSRMMDFVYQDKKRSAEGIRFPLLEKPGKAVPGIVCDPSEVLESMDYYRTLEG